MAEWRLGVGWSEPELRARLNALAGLSRNFDDPADRLGLLPGWRYYGSDGTVGREAQDAPVPGGPFERGKAALTAYRFSHPSIVRAYFDADAALTGRRMLLELRALGLRYLCGVIVGGVDDAQLGDRFTFGFRYDTLEGHIERGAEWFLLTKVAATGEIAFSMSANWREGQFPNWWSRVGFAWVGRRYQRLWHRRSRLRLAGIIAKDPETAAWIRPKTMLCAFGPSGSERNPGLGTNTS